MLNMPKMIVMEKNIFSLNNYQAIFSRSEICNIRLFSCRFDTYILMCNSLRQLHI